jgi:hypothetical protein
VGDLFEKVGTFTQAKEAMEMGIYPYFRALSDSEGTTAVFEGKEVVMIGSNNYLGLTTDPRVRKAAVDAIERFGTSVTGSRFLNGTLEPHLNSTVWRNSSLGSRAGPLTGYRPTSAISASSRKGLRDRRQGRPRQHCGRLPAVARRHETL